MTESWFTFPVIDPVAFAIGPLAIRWYALAYMAGLLCGWQILRHLAKRPGAIMQPVQVDQLLNYIIIGVIVGGRLGYVVFYQPLLYWQDPMAVWRVWEGGMAFHGGFLGVVVAVFLFARRHHIPLLRLSDHVGLVAPLGLLFGRLANFINGELFGRITTHPIGMVFPTGGPLPRHPSQLYEAGLEGLLLGVIFALCWRAGLSQKQPGSFIALFLIGYGLARFVVEFFREPDAHIGLYEWGSVALSQGQLLSLPMIIMGGALLVYLPCNHGTRKA